MELNLSPVKVDVNIENYIIKSDAFYNVCFITEDDLAPRTVEVRTLDDLLKNGYYRFSLAYDFSIQLNAIFVIKHSSFDCFFERLNSVLFFF